MNGPAEPEAPPLPAPLAAFLLFLAALAALALGGLAVARLGLGLWAVAPLQLCGLLLPALLWALHSGEPRSVLPMGRPAPGTLPPALLLLAGATLVALGMAAAAYGLLGERESERALREALSGYGVPLRLLLFAAVPALCEELFFRGAVLSCLRGWGRGRACLATALLFALLHLDPVKMAPVGVLGFALAVVVWECGSLWPAIAGHAFHNALVLLLAGRQGAGEGAGSGVALHAAAVGAGLVGAAAGWAALALFRRRWA